jgi:organic radical activating enzyme
MNSKQFSDIPLSEISRLGHRGFLYKDLFSVHWVLGRYCNYSCSYCWSHASIKQKDHRSFSVIIKTIEEIKRQARNRNFNSFQFCFTGGEATLHPDFLEILKALSSDTINTNFQSLSLTTNLSLGLSWWDKFIKATENLHIVNVSASYHKPFAKRDLFSEKLIKLQENDVKTIINMVMVPENFSELLDDAKYFNSLGLNVSLKVQTTKCGKKIVDGYSVDQLDILKNQFQLLNFAASSMAKIEKISTRPLTSYIMPKDSGPQSAGASPSRIMQMVLSEESGQNWQVDQAERLNALGLNSFKNWTCSAGYRSIIVYEPGGLIKRGYSCTDKPLGTIEDGFSLFPELTLCKSEVCICSADSKIPKRKAESNLPLWPQAE